MIFLFFYCIIFLDIQIFFLVRICLFKQVWRLPFFNLQIIPNNINFEGVYICTNILIAIQLKVKQKRMKKTYYFVLIYDDVTHTTFKVFVNNDVFVGIRKTYKNNDDISKILSFVKNYNNDDFHCVINKIF